MTSPDRGSSRRLVVIWLATVAVCLGALGLAVVLEPRSIRILGFDLADGLAGTGLLSASAVCLTTVQMVKARRQKKRITVRELRRRAGWKQGTRTRRERKRPS